MDCFCKIADCVCKMIEPLVNKLKEATIDEIKFQWEINDEIEKLTHKLGELKQLTFDPKPNTSLAEVDEARHAAFDIEDALEEYELEMELLESNKPSNFCELNNIGAFKHYFIETAKLRFQFHQKVKSMEPELVLQAEGEGQTAPEEVEEARDHRMENVDVVGMDEDFAKLRDLVEQPRDQMKVIIVWGSGGSGKTTLVKKVYERVQKNKEIDCCAWVYAKQPSSIDVLRSMVEAFSSNMGGKVPDNLHKMNEHDLRQSISKILEQKRYVLILDDVWDENIIPSGLPVEKMSSIIVTSRQKTVALGSFLGVGQEDLPVKRLNTDLSRELFCKVAFCNSTPRGICPIYLKKLADQLLSICDGLPLAILAIAQLMATKGNDPRKWNDVITGLSSELPNDLAQLNRALLLSYHHLPIHLKPCFLYCAMFPKFARISIHKLMRLWIAEVFVKHDDRQTPETVARGYFDELINRSMLQFRYESKGFQMHDLLREVAVHMIAKENFGKLLYQNTVEEDQRRLAIHVKAPNVQLDTGKLKLRSLLASSGDLFYSSLSQMLQNIKLIRTLDLEGVDNINNVPDEVGDLIHLRYLSLRRTKLCDLPDSVKKLRHLKTLDVRNNVTTMKHVPTGIAELKGLRHLLINAFGVYTEMLNIALEFTQLQSLDGVHLNLSQARQMMICTTQLTKLNISFTGEESWKDIFTAMGMMNNLQTLKLWASDYDKRKLIKLGNLSASPFIEKLTLVGFTGVRDFITSHENLREIKLWNGDLDKHSFIALGQLPRLEVLDIYNNYQENQLICIPESFPALKVFGISEARDLTTWSQIPKGSMKCLHVLRISRCRSLQMLPDGLQELKNLQELGLPGMKPKFLQRIDTGGPDHWKIQHIPRIRRPHGLASYL